MPIVKTVISLIGLGTEAYAHDKQKKEPTAQTEDGYSAEAISLGAKSRHGAEANMLSTTLS